MGYQLTTIPESYDPTSPRGARAISAPDSKHARGALADGGLRAVFDPVSSIGELGKYLSDTFPAEPQFSLRAILWRRAVRWDPEAAETSLVTPLCPSHANGMALFSERLSRRSGGASSQVLPLGMTVRGLEGLTRMQQSSLNDWVQLGDMRSEPHMGRYDSHRLARRSVGELSRHWACPKIKVSFWFCEVGWRSRVSSWGCVVFCR